MAHNRYRIVFLLIAALVLVACGEQSAPPPQPFKEQTRALDKARGVEQTLQQSDQKQREEIEDSSK